MFCFVVFYINVFNNIVLFLRIVVSIMHVFIEKIVFCRDNCMCGLALNLLKKKFTERHVS